MTNFEELMNNVNKANEEIERMVAETRAMKQDIEDTHQAKLNTFKAKLKPITDTFYSSKTPFSVIRLKTGIRYGNEYEILICYDKGWEGGTVKIGKKKAKSGIYVGSSLINIASVKKNDTWDYYNVLLKLLDNIDTAIDNAEQDFARQITEYIDKEFLRVASDNDKIAAEWRKTCVSDKPFYTESWNDSDIIAVLERAGKPVNKANITALKSMFIVHLQMDGVVIRKELLDDLAKEVDA